MKVKCPVCGKEIDITKYGRYAPHMVTGKSRCSTSGKRAAQ